MRTLQVITLALLATVGKADSVLFTASGSGLVYFNFVDGFVGFEGEAIQIRINSGGATCYDRCTMELGTGSVLSSTPDSWTFDGGNLRESGGETATPPTYPGYPLDCADVGLENDPYSGCLVPNNVFGHTIGTGTIVRTFNGEFEFFTLDAPIAFDINSGLADYLGVTTGPYVGTYHAQFFARSDSLPEDGALNGIGTLDQEFSGQSVSPSVPEPSTVLLLATVVIGLGCYSRWRPKKSGPAAL